MNPLAMQRAGAKRSSVVSTKTIPAPVGGLNSRDAVANMQPTDAVLLDNIFPGAADVSLRKGRDDWATGVPGSVETLAAYRSATISKLFAFGGSGCYDATTRGAVGDPLMSGLRSTRFQTVNFGTPGGHFLWAVNGIDEGRMFDGTSWRVMNAGTGVAITSITAVGTLATLTTTAPHGMQTGQEVLISDALPTDYNGAFVITVTSPTTFTFSTDTAPATAATTMGSYVLTPNVTGVETSLFDNVAVFGQRVWFTQRASFVVWYLPVASIGGAATSMDLSSLFELGGSLAGVVNWTVAGSQTTTAYAAFVSTEGEIAIYTGYDPDNADTWGLAGIVRAGRPIGKRFYTRLGSDVILITVDGFVPLSKIVINDRAEQSDAVSYKIAPSVISDIEIYGSNFGWQAKLYPIGNKLIFNVPTRENDTARQYVMNTVTKAWCRYIGHDAVCWETLGDQIFYGGAGEVFEAETGYLDVNEPIQGVAVPAFSNFGAAAQQKRFSMCRPVISTQGAATLSIALETNYAPIQAMADAALDPHREGLFWDWAWNQPWSDALTVTTTWRTVGGFGFAATIKMALASAGAPLSWQATSFVFETGGLL